MKWTRAKPAAPDTWWWYRDLPRGEALRVAHVICDRHLGWVVFFDGSEVDRELSDCVGEWAGPLSPPEDA